MENRNDEIGAREREPPQSSLKNAVINMAAFSSLKNNNQGDLRQFSNQNITQHRNNDIVSEKQESKLERKSYKTDNARNILVDVKIDVAKERTDTIKAEFGSIENYNNFKNAAKIESNRQSLVESKKRLSLERTQLIKTEYSSFAEYKEAQGVIDSENRRNTLVSEKKSLLRQRGEVVKSGGDNSKRLRKLDGRISNVDGRIRAESANIKAYFDKRPDEVGALRASGNRTEFLQNRQSLYSKSERLSKVDERYSHLTRDINRCTAKLKTVNHTQTPENVVKADKKYTYFDGKINKCSDKLRKHSALLDGIRTERSDSKYFRAGFDGHYRNSINSTDKLERKAAKAEIRLDKANKGLPKHIIIRKSYQFDHEIGKVKKKLIFEKEVKPIDGGLISKGLKGAGTITALRLSQSIHSQLSKNESELQNVGAKAAHTAERFAEHTAVKTAKHAHKFLKERPYKRVSKLQTKSDKANAKLYAKRKGGTARQMKRNAKQYMNRAKQARNAQKTVGVVDKAMKAIGVLVKKLACSPYFWLLLAIVAGVILVFGLIVAVITSIGSNGGAVLGAYLAEDSQIHAAEQYAQTYEATAVQSAIDSVTAAVNHDVLYINPYSFNRNPYALISFLSAYSFSESGEEYDNSFNANNANTKAAIERFINTYYYVVYGTYSVTTTVIVGYDEDDTPITEDVVTVYLVIDVRHYTADDTAYAVFNSGSPYTPEMYDLYLIYMETQGFRPDLFPAWAN